MEIWPTGPGGRDLSSELPRWEGERPFLHGGCTRRSAKPRIPTRIGAGTRLAMVPDMDAPTPRQQAGYLRRLLRRGELEVLDPMTGGRTEAMVEVCDKNIRILPLPAASSGLAMDERRWRDLERRLRAALDLEAAEELVRAVELENARERALKAL